MHLVKEKNQFQQLQKSQARENVCHSQRTCMTKNYTLIVIQIECTKIKREVDPGTTKNEKTIEWEAK